MTTGSRQGLRGVVRLFSGLAALSIAACSAGDEAGAAKQAVKPGTDTGTSEETGTDGGDGGDGGAGPLCPTEQSGTLNTFIGMAVGLEIDQSGSEFGPNANLYVGNDPADGSASYQKPTVASATGYIDWQTLGTNPAYTLSNHRILDVFPGNGEKDPSSFPGNSSCVGPANNPSKDELLYVGAANNNSFLYLNVLRASNLGDMGYTWLFTKEKPVCANKNGCSSWLEYTLSPGDVLLFGHFGTDGTQALRAFTFAPATVQTAVAATDAINWGPDKGLWTFQANAVEAVAINTDKTAAGIWGTAGLKNPLDGNTNIEDHVFAEGAVKTEVFVGQGGSVCGKSFWATVISKSSGTTAGGADVKDLIGPTKMNFGAVVGTANAVPNCDGTVNLTASATDGGSPPAPIAEKCTWYEEVSGVKTPIPGLTPDACDINNVALSNGSHNLSVTITESGGSGCSTTVENILVSTQGTPTIAPSMTANCSLEIDYSATTGSTSGTVSVQWTFDNGVATPAVGSTGKLTGLTGGTLYTGTAEVTDVRPDGKGGTITCKASNTASATPYGAIVPTLTPAAAALTCTSTPAVSTDAVTFKASATGGLPPYTFTWTGCTVQADTSECVVDPADATLCSTQAVSVKVDDSSALCAETAALNRNYKKETIITVSTP